MVSSKIDIISLEVIYELVYSKRSMLLDNLKAIFIP